MQGEFNTDLMEIAIENGGEEIDEEKESLRTQVGDLQRNLEIVRMQLAKSEEDRNLEHDTAVHLREHSQFLLNHVNALEAEVSEKNRDHAALNSAYVELQVESYQF